MVDKTARDVEVLLPDIEVQVIDPDTRKPVTLTVREYRFLEGLEAQVAAAPLADERPPDNPAARLTKTSLHSIFSITKAILGAYISKLHDTLFFPAISGS